MWSRNLQVHCPLKVGQQWTMTLAINLINPLNLWKYLNGFALIWKTDFGKASNTEIYSNMENFYPRTITIEHIIYINLQYIWAHPICIKWYYNYTTISKCMYITLSHNNILHINKVSMCLKTLLVFERDSFIQCNFQAFYWSISWNILK